MESINIEKTLDLPYTIKIVNEDDVFYAEVEEIPGCFSEGNTVEEAYANMKDAMRLWMENAIERNIQIPVPKNEEEREFSGRIMLRMPKELHKSLTKSADNDGISLNQFIVFLLSTNFAIQSIKQPFKSRKKLLVTR